jgi:hypothetical protein
MEIRFFVYPGWMKISLKSIFQPMTKIFIIFKLSDPASMKHAKNTPFLKTGQVITAGYPSK